MNSNDPMIIELEGLLAALCEGELTPAKRDRLRTLLRDHPEARRFYKRYLEVHALLEWEAGAAAVEQPVDEVLHMLRDIESSAVVEPVRLHDPSEVKPSKPAEDRPDFNEVAGLVWSFASQPKVWAPLAAVVALTLGITVVVLSTSTNTTSNTPAASATPTPRGSDTTTTLTTQPVATITATHNAVWASKPAGDLRRGTPLTANQRLTLTQGFAEITTNRGAVAVLEAPATLEILGNNRIALASGTLIGQCPTEASRGFIVDTADAQIVDVGTRFGVWVDPAGQTMVEVFTGAVQVQPNSTDTVEPATLVTSGQSARVQNNEIELGLITENTVSRFASGIAWQRERMMGQPSLIAYYRFDRPGETILRESRGLTRFDAPIVGAQWAQGRAPGKRSLVFTGKGYDERVVLSQDASDRLKLTGSYTLALWVYISNWDDMTKWRPIVTKGNDSWRLMLNHNHTTARPRIGFYRSNDEVDSAMRYDGVVTENIELNRWHHVVVTGQPDSAGEVVTTRLYIDGQLQAEKPFPRALVSGARVAFGAIADQPEDFVFNGKLAEVAFFDRAIPQAEVHLLADPRQSPTPEP